MRRVVSTSYKYPLFNCRVAFMTYYSKLYLSSDEYHPHSFFLSVDKRKTQLRYTYLFLFSITLFCSVGSASKKVFSVCLPGVCLCFLLCRACAVQLLDACVRIYKDGGHDVLVASQFSRKLEKCAHYR